MWVTRDKNGELWLHKEKPVKFRGIWCSAGDTGLVSVVDKSFFKSCNYKRYVPIVGNRENKARF